MGSNENRAPESAPISIETAAAGWTIAEYLIPHAMAAFGEMTSDPRHDLAHKIAKWVEKRAETEFRQRDWHRDHPNRTPEEIDAALLLLVNTGHIRPIANTPDRGGPGRKPGPRYLVNPHILRKIDRIDKIQPD